MNNEEKLHDRQAAAGRQGREFERYAATWLKIHGHEVIDRRRVLPDLAVEIDIVTRHPTLGEIWVECKGSWESPTRNGLQRTDTLLKAIGRAALIRRAPNRRPYWLICSHLPVPGSRGDIWLATISDLFDEVIEP